MSTIEKKPTTAKPGGSNVRPPAGGEAGGHRVGPVGRLGRYTATHFRLVLAGWLVVAVVLGFFRRVSKPRSQVPAGRRPARSPCRPANSSTRTSTGSRAPR